MGGWGGGGGGTGGTELTTIAADARNCSCSNIMVYTDRQHHQIFIHPYNAIIILIIYVGVRVVSRHSRRTR